MARSLKASAQALAVAVVVGLLALLVWKIVNDEGGAASALRRGEQPVAPDFTLARLDRPGELTLSSLRGKAVVLNFWASWCIPCKKEAPMLEAAWKRWRSKGVVVVGIDEEDLKSDARRFMRRYGVTYPNVYDGKQSLAEPYGLLGYPETFFVGRDGRLVHQILGPITKESELEEGIELALAQ